VTDAQRKASGLADGPMRAAPYLDPANVPRRAPRPRPSPSPAPGKAPRPSPSPVKNGGSDAPDPVAPPRAFDEDPFSQISTYWYEKDRSLSAYPDYKYDVALTPVGGPPDDPWEFLIEVVVRWAEKGARRQVIYQSVFLKKLSYQDVKPQ
jgi:hypothetical protein